MNVKRFCPFAMGALSWKDGAHRDRMDGPAPPRRGRCTGPIVYIRKLGIFVKIPIPGEVKTRLVPPLTPLEASDLYGAMLADLLGRLSKLKKISMTVFHAGEDLGAIDSILPAGVTLARQEGDDLGERLENAFARLLGGNGGTACVIGSDSPDLPLAYIKRAYMKLKHKDVVLGPTLDGGYYLLGLRRIVPRLFRGIPWGGSRVFAETLAVAEAEGISCAFLPPWYDVDDAADLSFLESMLHARRLERRDRLGRVERALVSLAARSRK